MARRPTATGEPPGLGPTIFSFLVGLAISGGSLFLLIPAVRDVDEAFESRGWPSAPGNIIFSEVNASSSRHGTSYSPKIEYSYQVQGSTYTGSVISPGRWWSGWSAYAARDRFPLGSHPPIYYDSKDPHRAVLVPGLQLVDFDSFFLGAMLFFLGLPFFLTPFQRNSQYLLPDGTMEYRDHTYAGCFFMLCVVVFIGSGFALFVLHFW